MNVFAQVTSVLSIDKLQIVFSQVCKNVRQHEIEKVLKEFIGDDFKKFKQVNSRATIDDYIKSLKAAYESRKNLPAKKVEVEEYNANDFWYEDYDEYDPDYNQYREEYIANLEDPWFPDCSNDNDN